MGKKRKSLATSLDEVDLTMYTTFRSTANTLSLLYTQAMNQQKLSFQAGERHGLEKLHQWILRQQEGGARISAMDILSYLQTEMDYYGEEPTVSLRTPMINPQLQHGMQLTNSSFPVSSGSSGVSTAGQWFRPEHCDQQSKNHIFSNALSSPVCHSLQNYHNAQGDYYLSGTQPSLNAFKDLNPFNSTDSPMEMHADSPFRESCY